MEVVPVSGGGAVQLPFQRRNVEEWSRFDRLTGMLEHTRVETDQWAANTSSSTRKYGKVVDSRARNLADGSVQQRQRKQLEVFQEQVPGGSLQVIRTHSVTSTSSSSTSTNWRGPAGGQPNNFDSLQLSVNPLNFGPQKTKATVGRSGSIGGRRPPSRPRGIVAKVDSAISEEDPVPDVLNNLDNRSINSRLPEASRICQQIHEEAKKTTFGNTPSLYGTSGANFHDEIEIEVATPRIEQLQCSSTEDEDGDVKIEEISDNLSLDLLPESSIKHEQTQINGSIHKHVIRKKSSSTEDLHNTFLENKIEKKEDNGEDLDWRRTSLIRRSLQFPSKATQETSATPQRSVPIKFENGRVREGNALKGYEALESVFIRGANIADSVNKSMTYDRDDNESPFTDSLASHLRNESMSRQHSNSFGVEGFSRRTTNIHNNPPNKRHSFVTVESLKEVRGRLRRLSSPPLDGMQQQDCFHNIKKPVEDNDDGIVTEDTIKSLDNEEATTPSCVSSYVFGIKALSNSNSNVGRKAFPGTGSLESRTSNKLSGGGSNRSEEWYNRRKSYGFEQVHSHETDDHSSSIKFRDRNKVESSTDSGICRSSEAVTAPLWGRTVNQVEETDISKKQLTGHSHMNDAVLQVSHSIQIKKPQNEGTDMKKQPSEAAGSINEGRRTVVMLGNEFCSSNLGHRSHDNNAIIVHSSIMKDSSLSKNGFRTTSGDESNTNQLQNLKTNRDVRRLSEPVTITIPIVSEEKEENSSVESKRLFFRQLSEGTSLSVESSQDKPLFMNSSTHKDSPSSSFSRSSSQAGFLRGTWTSGDDWSNTSKILDSDLKRHSIAVDESKYMREGLRSYNHNETNKNNFEKELANVSTSELVKRFAALNSFKQEELSFSNKDSGSSSTSGINVSFIQNGEVLTNHDENTEELQQQNNKKQKKVEFCKTEVHFAAESGRFNIVETDEKPPPSNTFRRRRRISSANIGSIQAADSSKNNLPEVRFGDSPYEKKLLGGNENDNMKANLMDGINKTNVLSPLPKPETLRSVVLAMDEFQDDADKEDHIYTQANATIMTSLHHETSHMKSYAEESRDSSDRQVEQHNVMNVTQNEPLPRSILKNNKKPSFLLGENNDLMLDQGEDHDEKWGVRLRPVQSHKEHGSAAMWRSTVTLRSTAFESPQQQSSVKESKDLSNSSNGETELQKLLKSLRPAAQRLTVNDSIPSGSPKNSKGSPATLKKSNPENIKNGVQVKISATPPEIRHSMCSVADRIRQVEDLKHSSVETKGYSTRINFGAGEATVVETVSSDEQQNTSNNPPPPPPPSSCSTSLFQQSHQPKPIWLRREERKQDSMIIQDAKKQTTSNKGLVVRIGNTDPSLNEVQTSLTSFPGSSQNSDIDIGKRKKTTMITIDLTPSPVGEDVKQPICNIKRNKMENSGKPAEILLSPSLIMKTIHKPSLVPEMCTTTNERGMHCMKPLYKQMNLNSAADVQQETKETGMHLSSENFKRSLDRKTEMDTCLKIEHIAKIQRQDPPLTVPSQLAALKEMYYSGDLSDDSERADEEVRSYMSGGGDDEDIDVKDEDSSSVVSGSWSRMRAYRNIQHHFHKFSLGSEPHIRGMKIRSSLCSLSDHKKHEDMSRKGCSNPEIKDDEPQQCAVATAVLPSYDNNRLRTVETLVSTRSGQPKITSISLRYEGDQDLESGPTGGARCKDLLGYSGRNSCNDIQERKMKVHNQANEASVHHFSSKSQGHSVIKGKTSLLEDKVHSNSFVKSNELNFQSKLENKSPQLLDDMTYQKGKQSSCVMNDGFYKEKRQVSGRIHCEFQEQSYKAGRHDTTIENESMYIGRNRPSHLRERRSKSPEESTTHLYTNVLPSAGGRKSTYSPIKKSSSPITATIHYHDTEKDSIPPPATKSQANTASLVPQHSTHEVHVVKTMKENSNYSSVYSQESQCKPDVRKQNSANKAMKEHQSTNTSSVSKGRKTIKRLHGCDSEEMSLNTAQQTSAEKYQHDECNYTMGKKSSRAQAATHGRDQSPNKTPTNNEAVTLRNSFDHKTKRENHENPIYENSNAFSQDYNSKTLRRGKTEVGENESTILEELTRAADQILQAVNGYTDDESNRASSEDDEHGGRHRRGRKLTQVKRPSASLGTISETASTHKQKDGTKHGKTDLQKTGGYVKRTQRLSKVHVGQNSSTSSVESFTREVRRSSAGLLKKEGLSSMEDHSKRKLTSSGSVTKSGSRTARLLQRASSREMLLQAHASSSEDIMSGAEGGVNRKPRVPRRNRTHNTNMTKTSSLTSITSNTKKAPSPSSSAQHAPSLVTTRLKKKDDETLKGRERSSAPVSKVKTCATDHSKGQNVRTRDVLKTGQNDESHRKPSKRDGAEIKQRTVKEVTEKMAGNSFTPLSTCREKVDRNPSERRLVGNVGNSAVVRSSTSHVLAKRRPSSSRNEGLSQNKSSK